MLGSTSAVCTELSPNGHLLYRTIPSGPGGLHATIDNSSSIVYLERRNLTCAAVDFTEVKITGGWGPHRHIREMPHTLTEANVDAEYGNGNGHCNMAYSLGTGGTASKPPGHGTNTKTAGLSATLRARYGLNSAKTTGLKDITPHKTHLRQSATNGSGVKSFPGHENRSNATQH
jgi:hypothetical protein